ncbi:MAG: hypothetical protein R3F07_15500 [Opitutaceae bacterium]
MKKLLSRKPQSKVLSAMTWCRRRMVWRCRPVARTPAQWCGDIPEEHGAALALVPFNLAPFFCVNGPGSIRLDSIEVGGKEVGH